MPDLWSAIVSAKQQSERLNNVFSEIEQLSIRDKAELVNKLLETPGLSIIVDHQRFPRYVIVQSDTTERETLANMLEIIAQRIVHKP